MKKLRLNKTETKLLDYILFLKYLEEKTCVEYEQISKLKDTIRTLYSGDIINFDVYTFLLECAWSVYDEATDMLNLNSFECIDRRGIVYERN